MVITTYFHPKYTFRDNLNSFQGKYFMKHVIGQAIYLIISFEEYKSKNDIQGRHDKRYWDILDLSICNIKHIGEDFNRNPN